MKDFSREFYARMIVGNVWIVGAILQPSWIVKGWMGITGFFIAGSAFLMEHRREKAENKNTKLTNENQNDAGNAGSHGERGDG